MQKLLIGLMMVTSFCTYANSSVRNPDGSYTENLPLTSVGGETFRIHWASDKEGVCRMLGLKGWVNYKEDNFGGTRNSYGNWIPLELEVAKIDAYGSVRYTRKSSTFIQQITCKSKLNSSSDIESSGVEADSVSAYLLREIKNYEKRIMEYEAKYEEATSPTLKKFFADEIAFFREQIEINKEELKKRQ